MGQQEEKIDNVEDGSIKSEAIPHTNTSDNLDEAEVDLNFKDSKKSNDVSHDEVAEDTLDEEEPYKELTKANKDENSFSEELNCS